MNKFNIELKVTERDKKILKYFGLFLIIIGFSFLVIKPSFDQGLEYSYEKSDLEFELEKMQNMVDNKDNLEKQVDNYTKLLKTKAENFYGQMTNQEIDNMITSLFLNYGLNAKDLNISVDEKKAALPNYTQNIKNKELNSAVTQEFSNIYVSNISVKSTGDKENFRRLIDHIYNEMPGILIDGYAITNETTAKNKNTVLSLSISIFMVSKE